MLKPFRSRHRLRWLLPAALAWLLLAATAAPAATVEPAMSLSAASYCLLDSDSGRIILAEAAHTPRPVASTTKMMTAILVDEYLDYEEIAVVSEHADHTPEYTIGLRAGQQVAVGELLKVALIRSSNDAAVALAEQLTGDEALFAELMSKKAFALGAVNTRFQNASGLPAEGHYSSAYDLALIGRELLRHPRLSAIVATTETTFQHPAYSEPLPIRNTNQLLHSYPGATGIKTGTTNAAGQCLVVSATRHGSSLIAVALHAPNRNTDCRRLLDYGFRG